MLLAEEIRRGESPNIEFKVQVPEKSEKYIKTVVAFANTSGGKIIIGVEDETRRIKSLIVVEIYPGVDRPYYIKRLGKEAGTFVRVSGTSRPADDAILRDFELQGMHQSFDEMPCIEQKYDEKKANDLCTVICSGPDQWICTFNGRSISVYQDTMRTVQRYRKSGVH